MEEAYHDKIRELGVRYLDEVHNKYKNYKNSPLGQIAILQARHISNTPAVTVQKMDGSTVTHSMRKYDELIHGGEKVQTVKEKFLRAQIQKGSDLWIQTLKKQDNKFKILREFKKNDSLAPYILRPFEGGIDREETPEALSKYKNYKNIPLQQRKKKITGGALESGDITFDSIEMMKNR